MMQLFDTDARSFEAHTDATEVAERFAPRVYARKRHNAKLPPPAEKPDWKVDTSHRGVGNFLLWRGIGRSKFRTC
jgi:hypothetical protein